MYQSEKKKAKKSYPLNIDPPLIIRHILIIEILKCGFMKNAWYAWKQRGQHYAQTTVYEGSGKGEGWYKQG